MCERTCIHGKTCIISPPNHQVHHTPDGCYLFPNPEWDFNAKETVHDFLSQFKRLDEEA